MVSSRRTQCGAGIRPDHEGWHIDNLAPNTDVALTDQDTSMMNRLCETTLEDKGLQATLHEVLNLEAQDIIQTCLSSSRIPYRIMRRIRACPSKIRMGSLSSFVRSVRAVARILARARRTRQISRLFLRPYWPMIFNSASRRSFSKGRRGGLLVLLKLRS